MTVAATNCLPYPYPRQLTLHRPLIIESVAARLLYASLATVTLRPLSRNARKAVD